MAMIDWGSLTLFLYILMRMTGFIVFNPIVGRSNFPGIFKAGMILLMSVSVYSLYGAGAAVPATLPELVVKLLLELGLGFLVATVMNIFFYIPALTGTVADEQMAMSMASTYDSGFQTSSTTTARLLNILMVLLFFEANGHITLLRLMLASGDVVPFGAAAFGDAVADRVMEVFIECTLLGVKMCLPILAAELMGQVGMGILMKVIPQINVFAINIELKVIVGLTMILLLMSAFSDYLLDVESQMLTEIEKILTLAV